MKKYLLTLIVTMLVFASLVRAADITCCPDCNTNVKVTQNMRIIQESGEHSKLMISGKITNIGSHTARNAMLTLEYTPNDYIVGPVITILPHNSTFFGPIRPNHERPYIFLVKLDNFYPFGPVQDPAKINGITFDVKVTGSNFEDVVSKPMSFLPKDEEQIGEITPELI